MYYLLFMYLAHPNSYSTTEDRGNEMPGFRPCVQNQLFARGKKSLLNQTCRTEFLVFTAFHGSGGFQKLAGRVGSGQQVVETSRVGSRRVRSVSNLTGRVGLGRVTLNRSDQREVMRPVQSSEIMG